MTELLVSYSDCLRFLGIDSKTAKDFEGTLCILPAGISLIDPARDGDSVLFPAEVEAHCLTGPGMKAREGADTYRDERQFDDTPIGELLLAFPAPWPRFKLFVDWAGWTGYIDAIEAVDWLLMRGYVAGDNVVTQEHRQPGQAEHPATVGVTVVLPHLSKELEAVFQIMRDNWTNPDPKRLPKQVSIAREIDDALGMGATSYGEPSRKAKVIAALIKPDDMPES